MTSLTIIGCGWLGTRYLNQTTHAFDCIITTSRQSIPPQVSCKHFYIDIYKHSPIQLPPTDICLISLPFSRTLTQPNDYLMGIQCLLPNTQLQAYDHIIFTSSTSVYPNTNQRVNETSTICTSTRALALHAVETHCLSHANRCHILRLSGICGGNRKSQRSVTKPIIHDCDTPLNLVHIDDIIHCIDSIIATKTDPSHDILNITCSEHPTRKRFYSQLCRNFNITAPIFKPGIASHKRVSNHKLRKQYKFSLTYDHPLSFCYD